MTDKQDYALISWFDVEFGAKLKGAFRSCSVTFPEVQVIEVRSADQRGEHRLSVGSGQRSPGRVVLKRNMTGDKDAATWIKEVLEKSSVQAQTNGTISVMDAAGKAIAKYDFINAWPTKVGSSEFNAATNDVGIEEIHLVCTEITRTQ